MEVGLGLQSDKQADEYTAIARRAEAAGFDVISVFHDLLYQPAIVPLTVIADQVAIPGMVDEKDVVKELMKLARTDTPAEPPPPAKIERGKERQSGLYIP